MAVKAVYNLPAPIPCTVQVGGVCTRPATHLLLVCRDDRRWESYPRCGQHPVADALKLLERASPDVWWVSVALTNHALLREMGATRTGC